MACDEEFTGREVIENKLLTALEDGSGKVAIVASKADLELLIRALTLAADATPSVTEGLHFNQFRADIEQLKRGAF